MKKEYKKPALIVQAIALSAPLAESEKKVSIGEGEVGSSAPNLSRSGSRRRIWDDEDESESW